MIIVDSREPAQLKDALPQFIDVTVETLKYGDYLWTKKDGSLRVIERKTLDDLISSLRTNRLEEQLAGCIKEYRRVSLLVEGSLFEKGGIIPTTFMDLKPEMFNNLMCSIQEHNIEFLWSPSLKYTPKILLALWKRDQKPQESKKLLMGKVQRKNPMIFHRDKRIGVLMAVWERLPEKVAAELVKQYGGLFGVLHAPEKDLLKIKGLGKGLIHNLYRSVGKS
jgi:ERCC4-type nuclease